MRLLTAIGALAVFLLTTAGASAQTSQNMVLEAHIPNTPCATGDVWALGNYMLLANRREGFSVIDTSDPSQLVVSRIVPPGYPGSSRSYGVGDIKTDGRYIYATNEYIGGGVFIYDSQPDPMNPTYVTTVNVSPLSTVHNCWIDAPNDVLYCVSRGRIVAVDVSDKSNISYLATLGFGLPGAGAHDVMVLDNRAYCSLWGGGIAIYDVTNAASPQLLAHKPYANSATHNMWPSEDRRYLYTTDENTVSGVGGFVRIWDISQLPAVTEVGSYKVGAVDSVVHNVMVYGELLFVSYYMEGLRVLSIKDPINPVEVAHYDTYVPTGSGCFGGPYAGCWGVYPAGGDRFFVSDMDNGGYILRLELVSHTFAPRSPTVPAGGTMTLDFNYQNETTAPMNGFGIVLLTAINGVPFPYTLLVEGGVLSAQQNVAHTFPIPVPGWIPPGWTFDFTAYAGSYDPFVFGPGTNVRVVSQ